VNSYTLAFCILGAGVLWALVLWSIPILRRRKAVVRFRKELNHLDLVALAWSQSLREGDADDELPIAMPEFRRQQRRRRGDAEDGGGALV
jgi:hypothetical protein